VSAKHQTSSQPPSCKKSAGRWLAALGEAVRCAHTHREEDVDHAISRREEARQGEHRRDADGRESERAKAIKQDQELGMELCATGTGWIGIHEPEHRARVAHALMV
jgi:hypothetical protein